MDKPVKLKVGDELMKQRGTTGPVRTVEVVFKSRTPVEVMLGWDQKRKGRTTERLACILPVEETGLPAGYVLAKDRQAKKAGSK